MRAYEGNTRIAGEISAVPYSGTSSLLSAALRTKMRLVNGSDYPAVTPYVFTRRSLRELRNRGYLKDSEVNDLDEVFRYNPLLFDFVLKRTLTVDGQKMPDEVFQEKP